jgi:hypothetical protein
VLSPYGGGRIPIGTTLSLWRDPPIGEQRAVTMWRRKDIHRDDPVTMKRKSLMGEQQTTTIMEMTYKEAVCCHYKGQERRRI